MNPIDNPILLNDGMSPQMPMYDLYGTPKKYTSPYLPGNTGIINTPPIEWENIWEQSVKNKRAEDILRSLDTNKRTLRYKGVTLLIVLENEVMEFFEDPKNITPDELRLLNLTFPKEYDKIKQEWCNQYLRLQATKVFESD